jgi:hypothetical protein
VIINAFLKDMYQQGDTFNEEYANDFYELLVSKLNSTEVSYIDLSNLEEVIPSYETIMEWNEQDFGEKIHNIEGTEELFDLNLIQSQSISIENYFEGLINRFADEEDFSIDDFQNTFYEDVENLVASDEINDYFAIKVFTDVYFSSFETWVQNLEERRSPQKEASWWDNFKTKAKEVWAEVKPIVKADAEGAVTGAMVAAVAGPGAGAVAGGCGASAGKAVSNLIGN